MLYLVFLFATVGTILYAIIWKPFKNDLENVNKPPEGMELPRYVSEENMWQLGSVHYGKRSSFVHYSTKKDNGYIRICSFGDSYVYGSEVADNHDYPSMLQREIRRNGVVNVEVLNFGNGWHGIHQAFIMLESVGKKFECDYVLLGPEGFWPRRETTFQHSGLGSPYYLHSRYVLEGDDLRRIDPIGSSYEERFDHYFRFVPHWQYVRYDRNPLPLVRAILPRNRTLENPFYYYSGTMEEEALEILKVLFNRLSKENVQTVIGFRSKKVVEVGNLVGNSNFVSAQFKPVKTFPYYAPKNHYSALGNQLVAQQFYSLIVAEPNTSQLTILKTGDISRDSSQPDETRRLAIASYDWIEVRTGDTRAGHFVTASPDLSRRGEGARNSLNGSEVVSLLAIKSDKQGILDACFAPLKFGLLPKADVTLTVNNNTGKKVLHIGSVELVSKFLNIGVVEIEGIDFTDSGRLLFHGNDSVSMGEITDGFQSGEIAVAGRTILEVRVDGKSLEILPKRGTYLQLRAGAGDYLDIHSLGLSGTFDFVFRKSNGATVRSPVARWEKVAYPRPVANNELALKLFPGVGNDGKPLFEKR